MFRSYWHIGLAIGLIALCGAAEGQNKNDKSGNNSKREQIPPPPTTPVVNVTVSAPKAEESKNKCAGSYEQNKSCDAISANAAVDQARYAFWQTIAAWFIGLPTLVAAGWAAFYAKRAAEETARSAGAAEEAISEARDIGKKQVRAYLGGEAAFVEEDERGTGGYYCRLALKNFGQSPAEGIEVASKVIYKTSKKTDDWPKKQIFTVGCNHPRTIAPGATGRCVAYVDMTTINAALADQPTDVRFYWVTDIWWLDVYGEEQNTRLEMSQPLGTWDAIHWVGKLDVGGSEPGDGGWTPRNVY